MGNSECNYYDRLADHCAITGDPNCSGCKLFFQKTNYESSIEGLLNQVRFEEKHFLKVNK